MGSGNTSGSFQSSSGGDDDYASRSDLPNPSSTAAGGTSTAHFGHVSATNQNQTLSSSLLFDPSTTYLSSLPQSNFIPHRRSTGNFPGGSSSKLLTSPSSEHQGPLNSKKRTRASRRAPTTVLTTDTSNFRAMVQEFTGIPAPPFAGSSYSRRLDLFGRSSLRSGHLDPLRPINPFLASTPSSLLDNVADTGPAGNYLNMQSPILSFQSLLQPPDQMLVGSTQLRDSAPPSDFDHRNTNHAPAPRGDGTVDSWICPSD